MLHEPQALAIYVRPICEIACASPRGLDSYGEMYEYEGMVAMTTVRQRLKRCCRLSIFATCSGVGATANVKTAAVASRLADLTTPAMATMSTERTARPPRLRLRLRLRLCRTQTHTTFEPACPERLTCGWLASWGQQLSGGQCLKQTWETPRRPGLCQLGHYQLVRKRGDR